MNPLQSLFEAGLSEVDVGVMQHGFTEHGRDYVFIIEDSLRSRPGTYRLTFTHVVELSAKTAVSPEAWGRSWSNDFIDYQRWQAAGEAASARFFQLSALIPVIQTRLAIA